MSGLGRYASGAARVILYVYGYVLLEWLFLATKPSFLGVWPAGLRIAGFWIGVLPFAGVALAAHGALCLLEWVVPGWRGRGWLSRIVPSLVATAVALMLVDNFTYTMFGWGVVSTTAWTVPLYWLLVLLVFAVHLRREPSHVPFRGVVAALLLLASSGVLLWALLASPRYLEPQVAGHAAVASPARAGTKSRPNIVFFASDGVTAALTSAYGNPRKTTPNLDAWLSHALVADNAFTNSGWTTGSLTSMMTGKYPATTKVMYPPYTLRGEDAYQSLPRMLHALGYVGIQETVRYYADGPDLNWRGAFDQANGRKVEQPALGAGQVVLLQVPLQLDDSLFKRLSERVLQLLFVERMADPHAEVTSEQYAKVYGTSDRERMQRTYAFIDHARKPFFVHIHLMGTHCCSYRTPRKVFSAGEFDTKSERKQAQLADAVLESDRLFGELIAHLQARHLLENTLIIYTSDHDNGWDFRRPVPLVFLFPGGAYRGHIAQTTQLLDVAPTVLDYMGVKIPDWMEGHSLLRGGGTGLPVFSVFRLSRSHFVTDEKDTLARVENMGPPTYGLDQMGMVVCQRWYVMNIRSGAITDGQVAGYRGSCLGQTPPPDEAHARQMISRHLHQRGFVF